MKRLLFYTALVSSLSLTAQDREWCGFDQVLKSQDKISPGLRQNFDEIIKKIQTKKNSNPSQDVGKLVNGVYEIPVVVHVIYPSGAAIGSAYNRSDAEIQTWIENANKMFVGTYPWPANTVPIDFGQPGAIPIKLVLAKRDPNCNSTNGIVRYNGGLLPGYNQYGVASETNTMGVTSDAVRALAPHWAEDTYFNLYVVNTFDGHVSPTDGLMGFATFPNSPDAYYDSFMKSGVVTIPHGNVLAHELGHAMGLYHTFEGGKPDAAPGAANFCPPSTGSCINDDDKVCDTERSGSAFTVPYNAVPTNSDLNICSGTNYQGVQYNLMNYSNAVAQKFTTGQADRVETFFMVLRRSLTTSKGATELPSDPVVPMIPVAQICTPTGTNTSQDLFGPVSVRLGQINNLSAPHWQGNSYYEDYTARICGMNNYTELITNQPQTIEVEFGFNNQSVRVWIDYNNNGTFENSELVGAGDDVAIGANGKGLFTAVFTPPSTAVQNTPLRMRVLADKPGSLSLMNPCGEIIYGQAEDYTVKLTGTLGTKDTAADKNDITIYPNPSSSGNKMFIKADKAKNLKISIYDPVGRLIATPSLAEENKGTYRINYNLKKGVYLVQISSDETSKTSKIIIN